MFIEFQEILDFVFLYQVETYQFEVADIIKPEEAPSRDKGQFSVEETHGGSGGAGGGLGLGGLGGAGDRPGRGDDQGGGQVIDTVSCF